jgi:hypothetical protein
MKGEHLPTEVGYDTKLQSGQVVRMTSMQRSFPEALSERLCRNYFLYKPTVSSAVRVVVSDYPQVKKPDVEGMACHGYTWPAVVRPVGCTAK